MIRFRPLSTPVFALMVFWVILGWAVFGPSVAPAWANAAKSQYLKADTCLKKLRKSPVQSQRVSAWLSCIEKYESIYRIHPSSSWAPAGMYKAAELYLQLYKRSENPTYSARSQDLLTRIKRKYPQSAYSGRAKILEKSIAALPRPKSTSYDNIKVLKSKKEETRDDAAIARYKQRLKQNREIKAPQIKQAKTVQAKSSPPDSYTKTCNGKNPAARSQGRCKGHRPALLVKPGIHPYCCECRCGTAIYPSSFKEGSKTKQALSAALYGH